MKGKKIERDIEKEKLIMREREKERKKGIKEDVNTNQHTHFHSLRSQRDEPAEKALKVSFVPLYRDRKKETTKEAKKEAKKAKQVLRSTILSSTILSFFFDN